jgi:hypothetical protein
MRGYETVCSFSSYEIQNFSSAEVRSYLSPLKVFGQVDFLIARRKYSRDMVKRAVVRPILDGELTVKVLLPEDLIGLKLQALMNDPKNRSVVDAPDIERLLRLHRSSLDMNRVREYFRVFDKEELLDGWLDQIDRG